MAVCENLATCPFYQGKISMDEGIGSEYKKTFCEENKYSCARYKVATTLGKGHVPMNLHPNMMEQANEIISNGKR